MQIFQRIVMQLQPDGSVGTLNLLDAGLLPYTRINGSTFPAPDPVIVAQTPSPITPEYATQIIQFVQAHARDTFEDIPVNFGATFNSTVTAEDASYTITLVGNAAQLYGDTVSPLNNDSARALSTLAAALAPTE